MQSSRKATTKTWGSWTDRAWTDRAWTHWVRPLPTIRGAVHLGCAGLIGLALFGWGFAEEPSLKPDAVAVFMRAKLAHSSEVLEGLALEDFDMIGRGAQELSLASQASSWQVLQTEDYARQSAEFRRSCDTLRTAAKARNLDGAALAWMDVTMKCIQCHKYVRDQK